MSWNYDEWDTMDCRRLMPDGLDARPLEIGAAFDAFGFEGKEHQLRLTDDDVLLIRRDEFDGEQLCAFTGVLRLWRALSKDHWYEASFIDGNLTGLKAIPEEEL